MLMREPFFQTRATEGVQAVNESQRLVENFCADEADQLLLEVQKTCRRRTGGNCHPEECDVTSMLEERVKEV